MMFWLWFGVVAIWAVGLTFLARWMHRREAEMLPHQSTLTDTERAQAQLGIAMTAGNTGTSPH